MIDAKKVYMMTRIASYEQNRGQRDRKTYRYSRRSFLALKQIGNFIAFTLAYLLAAGLFCVQYLDDILMEGLAYDYVPLAAKLLVGYVIVLCVGMALTYWIDYNRYNDVIKHIQEMDRELSQLENYLENKKESV